jgi:hypothetical protein
VAPRCLAALVPFADVVVPLACVLGEIGGGLKQGMAQVRAGALVPPSQPARPPHVDTLPNTTRPNTHRWHVRCTKQMDARKRTNFRRGADRARAADAVCHRHGHRALGAGAHEAAAAAAQPVWLPAGQQGGRAAAPGRHVYAGGARRPGAAARGGRSSAPPSLLSALCSLLSALCSLLSALSQPSGLGQAGWRWHITWWSRARSRHTRPSPNSPPPTPPAPPAPLPCPLAPHTATRHHVATHGHNGAQVDAGRALLLRTARLAEMRGRAEVEQEVIATKVRRER